MNGMQLISIDACEDGCEDIILLRYLPQFSAAARTLYTLAIQIRAKLRVRLVKRGQRTEPHISSFLFSVLCGSSFTAPIHTAGIRDRFPPYLHRPLQRCAYPYHVGGSAGQRM